MSETNKALCRRFIEEVWNNRRLSVIDELFAANYTEHNVCGPDFGRGPDSVRKMLNYYLTAFPDAHFTIEDLIVEEDLCALRWTARGTHRGELSGVPPTGKRVTVTGTTVTRIANGKFVESHVTWDALGMMQQLGVAPRETARRASAQ